MTAGASALARHVARHRHGRVWRRLAMWCRRYLSWYGNLDYDSRSNGEHRVLQVLARFEARTIVDAGANVGDWSLAAAALCTGAQVHAFEISPPTFETLSRRTAGEPRIRCHGKGLSDSPGTVRLRHFADQPALSTATGYPHPLPFTEIDAEVVAGADALSSLGLHEVDLLKIDVEGMEDRVLRGFDPLLRAGRIALVQFEYGRANVLTGFLLHHAAAFFRERGYVLGKIYPDGVEFREVRIEDEDFIGPNYLACRADRVDLIEALRG